ncbi:MAG: hypothetical protein N4J56_004632 [Chroococcidiopsis sp. SAG 2025]|nr:hypothetical protein [Chroococcidiopsis sp. SAG 2025]
MIRWRLKEVMARHDISVKDLAAALDVNPTAVSNLRKTEMPRINGAQLNALCLNLQRLSKLPEAITPADLIEYYNDDLAVRLARRQQASFEEPYPQPPEYRGGF